MVVIAGIAIAGPHFATAAAGNEPLLGIALGSTPELVRHALEQRFPDCPMTINGYRDESGKVTHVVASFEIEPLINQCGEETASTDVSEAVEARFAHPDVDSRQPLFALKVTRRFARPISNRLVRYRLSDVESGLIEKYGSPVDRQQTRTVYSPDYVMKFGLKGRFTPTEKVIVRYLWAKAGSANEKSATSDWGPSYVRAEIELENAKEVLPKGALYVVSVHIEAIDRVLDDRELERLVAKRQRTKERNTRF
jgi:hypothetical protein